MKIYQIILVITISIGLTSAGVVMSSLYETDSKYKIRQNYEQNYQAGYTKQTEKNVLVSFNCLLLCNRMCWVF